MNIGEVKRKFEIKDGRFKSFQFQSFIGLLSEDIKWK
jgi:hypothetical protein